MPSNQEVDITGLMVKAQPGWEERAAKLARPEFFQVKISPKKELWNQLTLGEQERLKPKLDMVALAARTMAAGMVKGTTKYASDTYSLKTWIAHLIGEGADQINYQLLLAHAFWELFKEAPDAPESPNTQRQDTPSSVAQTGIWDVRSPYAGCIPPSTI